MCKIVVMTNASKVNDMPAWTRLMADLLSDQKDGFGAVMSGINGVHGVKSLYPFRFAKNVKPMSFVKNVPDQYFGVSSPHYGPALFHGRVSTNVININNTHPMIKADHYMIHNGVVENEGEDYHRDTTNDSEDILYHFVTGGINKVSKNISGYYACAIINPDGTMTLFRDDIANLYCAWSQKLETYIFATTEKLIDSIGYHIKEELINWPVKDNVYLKFKGNDIIEESEFENLGFIPQHARASAAKSLGRELDDEWRDTRSSKTVSMAGYHDDIPEDMDLLDFVTEEYLDEVDCIDDRYEILTEDGKQISADEFYSLPLDCKITCTVTRPNGAKVDPFNRDVRKHG